MIKYSMPFRIMNYSDHTKLSVEHQTNLNLLEQSHTLNTGLVKTAKLVKIVPKEEDFLYVRVRAVSAGNVIEQPDGTTELISIDQYLNDLRRYAKKSRGANDNGDHFSYEELVKTYKTFIGKSAFVDHQNENVEKARGIILDAVWNEKGKFVELLMAIDKVAYPELARGVECGYITDVSMGCRCGYSICSICQNKAVAEDDFCEHIRNFKGSSYQGLPVFEDNRDIEFFECSFVTTGADPKAKIMERVAGRGMKIKKTETFSTISNATLTKVASEQNQRGKNPMFNKFKNDLNNLPWT